jgi:hypothetical protein
MLRIVRNINIPYEQNVELVNDRPVVHKGITVP